MKKWYQIGEVSRMLAIPAETLRFYERKGLLVPGKDEQSGYRYYSMADIFRLIDVLFFRDIGLPIEEIREILHAQRRVDMRGFFAEKQREVQINIKKQTMLLHKLQMLAETYQLIEKNLNNFSIQPHPSFYVLSAPTKASQSMPERQGVLAQLYHLCRLGGDIIREADGSWSIEKQYFSIARRAAADHGLTEQLDEATLVPSKRSAHTVVFLETEDALLQAVEQLLDWMENNGYSQMGTVHYRLLLSGPVAQDARSYAELWVPVV